MQDRRYRPGDVLDDYCPRERRITDHAIVAMIDDEIRRTRCGVCDAEHEYKEAKVPAPRRKTQPPALFNQVLEGLNGSAPKPAAPPGVDDSAQPEPVAMTPSSPVGDTANEPAAVAAAATETVAPEEADDSREQGGFRRSLIRATFPRPEGQAPPPRALPEFTVQSLNNRARGGGQRHAGGQNKSRGRRRPGGANQDNLGPMRFRDHGHGQGDGRPHGQGHGGGRRRRGGKKNR